MEHIFGYHEKKARKYSKQRAKQHAQKRGGKTVSYSGSLDLSGTQVTAPDLIGIMKYHLWEADAGSKWQRIGQPMLMNTFDQFIVLNPLLSPKMRLAAASRQVDEFMRHYERSGLGF